MTTEPIRILIVDDHPAFREGLTAILAAQPDIDIVGNAETGQQAIELAATNQPDVVLMDLQLPDGNGIDATRSIVQTSPHIAILVITMFKDDNSVFAAVRAGARGYLLKGATRDEITRAVRAVAGGEAIFGPAVAQRMLTYFGAAAADTATPAFPELTHREREVLNLIAAGKNNTEITRQLVLSPKTVRNHISNIFAKLQVTDRSQAIVRGRQAGLGRP